MGFKRLSSKPCISVWMISAHSETLASNNLPFTADDYTVRLGGTDCSVWGSCQRIQVGTTTPIWIHIPDKDPKKHSVKSGVIQTHNVIWINGTCLFVQQRGKVDWRLKLGSSRGEADLNKMEIIVVQQLTSVRRKRQKQNVKRLRMNGEIRSTQVSSANTGGEVLSFIQQPRAS